MYPPLEIENLIERKSIFNKETSRFVIDVEFVNLIVKKAIEVQDLQSRIVAFATQKPKIIKKCKKQLKELLQEIDDIK